MDSKRIYAKTVYMDRLNWKCTHTT